jgi:hypothetical protein
MEVVDRLRLECVLLPTDDQSIEGVLLYSKEIHPCRSYLPYLILALASTLRMMTYPKLSQKGDSRSHVTAQALATNH